MAPNQQVLNYVRKRVFVTNGVYQKLILCAGEESCLAVLLSVLEWTQNPSEPTKNIRC